MPSLRRAIGAALLLLVPFGAQSAGAAGVPSFAGTTTVVGRGAVRITLAVPRAAKIDHTRVELSLVSGRHAFAAVVARTGCVKAARPYVCMPVHAYRSATIDSLEPYDPEKWSPMVQPDRDSRLAAGLVDIYVVTDGEARFTVPLHGVGGRTTVRAVQRANAGMQLLPSGCGAPCADPVHGGSRVDFGGLSRTFGRVGFVGVWNWALGGSGGPMEIVTGPVSPGSNAVRACLYPHETFAPKASADPRDHPTGCDTAPFGDTTSDPVNGQTSRETQTFASQVVLPTYDRWVAQFSYQATGRQYAGFTHVQKSYVPEGGAGAYIVWLEPSA